MLNSTRESWSQIDLGDQNFYEKKGFFAWWYRYTSPPEPALGATLQQRDLVRRGRIASACMLFLAIILVFVAFVAYLGPNKQVATTIYILYPMIIICIFLNRQGKVNLVGILMTVALVGAMCLTLFTTAAGPGLGPNDKDILYLLFFAELFVAAVLPINYVFLVAAINIGISVYMLTYAHHTPALNAILAVGYASTLFRLMEVHVIVTGVLWILMNNNRIAIKRADRAEEMARLQRDLAQLSQEKAGEQEALEHSINLIAEAHVRASNGDLNARVAVDADNTFMLWQIAGPLNNLLSRYQNLLMEIQQNEQLIQVFQQLMEANPELARVVSIEMQRMHSSHSGTNHETNPFS